MVRNRIIKVIYQKRTVITEKYLITYNSYNAFNYLILMVNHQILMLAYNNASRVNVTETVFVREYIDGLNITGCNPDGVRC